MKKITLCAVSFGIYLLTIPIRHYGYDITHTLGFNISIAAIALIYFIFTVISLKRFGNTLRQTDILLYIALGYSIISLPLHILWFYDSLATLPDLLTVYLAILLGFVYYRSSSIYFKAISLFVFISFALWMATSGYSLWFEAIVIPYTPTV